VSQACHPNQTARRRFNLGVIRELLFRSRQLSCETAVRELLAAVQAQGLLRRGWRERHGEALAQSLLSMAFHAWDWLRSPRDWQPQRGSADFRSLASHLFAQYPVPDFFMTAWTQSLWEEEWHVALAGQNLYKHVARGGSPQSSREVAFRMTRRMGRFFLEAPAELTMGEALRWGQMRGLGAPPKMIRAVLGTEAGDLFRAPGGESGQRFWESVWRYFIEHSELTARHYAPIVDFLTDRRFEPVMQKDGSVAPAQPNLSMRNRSVAGLIREIDAWHGTAHKGPVRRWDRCGTRGFRQDVGEGVVWTIVELTSSTELAREGQALRHCVYVYTHICEEGSREVTQMRGESNRWPIG